MQITFFKAESPAASAVLNDIGSINDAYSLASDIVAYYAAHDRPKGLYCLTHPVIEKIIKSAERGRYGFGEKYAKIFRSIVALQFALSVGQVAYIEIK